MTRRPAHVLWPRRMNSLPTVENSKWKYRMKHGPSGERATLFGTTAVMSAGIVLRLAWFQYQPAFNHDEACLGVNLLTRGYLGLLKPLDFNQTSPPLFLFATKFLISTLGHAEWVFRLIPLVGSIATLILVFLLAKRLLGSAVAVVSIALAAICPLALSYSNVFKPYSSDPLGSAILLWLAIALLRDPKPLHRWVILWLWGTLVLLFCQPAFFIIGGILLALLGDPRFHRAEMAIRWMTLAGLWGMLLLWLYFTLYKQTANSVYMHYFWSGIMGRYPFRHPRFFLQQLFGPSILTTGLPAVSGFVIASIGSLAVWRKNGITAAILLTAPFGLVVLAHVFGVYPVYGRLILFVSPALFLLVAAAAGLAFDRLDRKWQLVAMAAIPFLLCVRAFCMLSSLPLNEWGSARPPVWPTQSTRSDDVRTVLDRQLRAPKKLEPVYILSRGIPSWTFYTVFWSSDPSRSAWLARMFRFGSPVFGDSPPRNGRPFESVPELVYSGAGLMEVLGLYSGVDNKLPDRTSKTPDPGWAEHETRRIKELGTPCAWIYSFHSAEPEELALINSLTAAGAVITLSDPLIQIRGAPAALTQICWLASAE